MTAAQAYKLLVTMLLDEKGEGSLQQAVSRLQEEFQTKAGRQEDQRSRRQWVQKLMREVQDR